MTDETKTVPRDTDGAGVPGPGEPAPPSEFSAAAPPAPNSQGAAETSFADAEAPGAGGAPAEAAAAEGTAPPAAGDKAAEFLALAQRTQADFDNYRKRMARENAQAAERGAAKLAKALLPALDHLELALNAADGDTEVAKGFAMVRDELYAALEKSGIEVYSPKGEPFDPAQHEAMAQQPAEGAESGTVLEVYQQGYRIGGSVLRPARVVVAQ